MTILTDENYVDIAEKAILKLERNTRNRKNPDAFFLTTSKLRNLLSLTSAASDVYKRQLLSLTSTLFDESKVKEYDALLDRIAYLRVQFVYQAGREIAVKDLIEKAQILEALKEIKDRETLQRFCRYMEALVAYFKFYGGKD